ncbi:Y1105-like protein [Mya arenaria]|uniref:Y1105-like protein n=1 Tax=Mya arenaria TaxID=6604 RepID=A0ABY7E213_MYAAR|nr:Y1105-like protein [Mya arenaria]
MSLTAEVLTHMRDKGLITENDHKDISDFQTETMRNRILLSKVSKQEKGGEGGYDLLKSCLREMGHAQCAELMEEKERELLTESFGLLVRLSTDEKASVTKCLHDGRLLEMTQAHIDVLKFSCFNTTTGGGFGKVYICNGECIGVDKTQFVLKEIVYSEKYGELATRSIANEKIASRLMHFAIVPLIAHFEDSRMRSYFLSPYLNNGSLFDALKCIRSKKDTILSVQGNRKKVLLHIASAIAYLHSEVKNFRSSVLHMDIKSNNIVLDGECNARLIDFGFARELKEGTTSLETKVYNYSDGYFPSHFPKEDSTKPTMRHDVYNFGVGQIFRIYNKVVGVLPKQAHPISSKRFLYAHGFLSTKRENFNLFRTYRTSPNADIKIDSRNISNNTMLTAEKVIREVVTALPPLFLSGEEKVTPTLRDELKFSISEFVLKPNDVAKDIWKVSKKCISDEFSPSKEIHIKLENITRQHMSSFKRWSPAQTRPPKCEICLVNPFEESGCRYLKHSKSCRENIKVCIACMRNSYFNPIKCHSCDKERIDPFIGVGWGAVFVAGYDSNPEIAEVFKKDVEEMRSCMTSVSLPVMCISEENTAVIEPNSGGNATPENECLERTAIENALKRIVDNDIETLVFYYSGHHGDSGFRLNDKTTMTIDEIGDSISDIFNEQQMTKEREENTVRTLRVLLFLDCCMPGELKTKGNQNINIIQFNACADTEEAIVEKKESIFTKFVIQAFTKKASAKKCLNEVCSNQMECGIEGNFVTMDALLQYVNKHVSDAVVGRKSSTQVIARGAFDPKDVIIGYNYDFKMEFAFTPYGNVSGERKKLKTVTLKPDDFKTIAEAKEKIARHATDVFPRELTLKQVIPDLLSIEISTGPRRTQKEEVCTMEQLLSAWNGKRQLEVIQRGIEDIAPDKPVGVVVQNGESLRDNLIRLVKENKLKASISEQIDAASPENWTSFAVKGEDVKESMKTLPSGFEAFFQAMRKICEIQPDRRWTRVLWKFRKDSHWQPIVILEVELRQ